jgi:hypothetical protein
MNTRKEYALKLIERFEEWVKKSDNYQLDFGDSLEEIGMEVTDDNMLDLLAYIRDRITD